MSNTELYRGRKSCRKWLKFIQWQSKGFVMLKWAQFLDFTSLIPQQFIWHAGLTNSRDQFYSLLASGVSILLSISRSPIKTGAQQKFWTVCYGFANLESILVENLQTKMNKLLLKKKHCDDPKRLAFTVVKKMCNTSKINMTTQALKCKGYKAEPASRRGIIFTNFVMAWKDTSFFLSFFFSPDFKKTQTCYEHK